VTPDRFLSPTETATRLGVSVRALRLYERKGLVSPKRTGAGWRVYGPSEIERVHQVLALRSLGLSLTRIGSLFAGREPSLDALLSLQEQVLSRHMAEAERALGSIRAARAKLAAGQTLSLDDIINLAREAVVKQPMNDAEWDAFFEPFYRRRLSPAQYDRMMETRANGLKELGLTEGTYNDAWQAVIADATRLMERGEDASPEAADVLRRWTALTDVFTKGDEALMSGSLLAFYDAVADPAVAQKSPISEDLLIFMNLIGLKKALASQVAGDLEDAPSEGEARATEAALRGLIEDLRRGKRKTAFIDADPAKAKGPPIPMLKAILAALGPLKSVRYLRSESGSDIHRAVFARGSLLCTVALDADGELTKAELVTG
jgi:DNA-binding transcriptional MerR regulator